MAGCARHGCMNVLCGWSDTSGVCSPSPLSTGHAGKLGCLQVAALSTQSRAFVFPGDDGETPAVELTWDSAHHDGRMVPCPEPAGLIQNQKMRAWGPSSPWTRLEGCRSDPLASTAASVLPRTRLVRIKGGRRMSVKPSTELSDCGIQFTGYGQKPGNIT